MFAPIAFSRIQSLPNPLRGTRALRGIAAATAFAVTFGMVSLAGSAAVAEEGDPAPIAPVAVADAVTVTKKVDTWITVTDNDSDADSAFHVADVTQPANGQVFAIENTRFRYASDAGFAGVDTVTYRLMDGGGLYSEWVTVEITVPNAAPSAVDDQITGAKNIQNTGNVLLNDSDSDGDALTVTWGTPSTAGFLGNDAGVWSWSLGTFGGVATVPYTLHDGYGGSDEGLLTVVVPEYGDDAPVLVADSYTVVQDTVLTVAAPGVLANDSDPDGSPFKAMIVPQSIDHGTLVGKADGSFVYTPDAGFVGTDTFFYQAFDADLHQSAPQTVTIEVTPGVEPQAFWDLYWTPANTLLMVNGSGVLSNDVDADTAEVVTDPSHGTLSFGADGRFTYQPDAGFVGSDSFQYRAVNSIGASNSVMVAIEVGGVKPVWFHPPVAVADAATTNKGEDVVIDVLGNDTIPVGGQGTIVTAAAGASNGQLVTVDQANGTVTYRPDAGYAGPDGFSYAVYDSRGVMSGWVSVTINVIDNTNQAPVVTDLQLTRVKGSAQLSYGNAFDLVNDPEGNDVTITWDAMPAVGTFFHDIAAFGNWQWVPPSDYVGVETIVFTATDALGASAQGTITIAVVEDELAPVALDDSYGTSVGTTLVVNAANGLFANDIDADSQWVDMQVVAETSGLDGTVTVAGDGSFEFTPTAGFNGITAFHYKLIDDTGRHSAPAKVTISVSAVPVPNAAPVAAADAYAVGQDALLTVAPAAGVLANDVDADGDQLTVSGNSMPANGAVTVNADGSFEYTPNAGFAGTDSFEYSVTDGTAIAAATVTITVTAAPVPAGNAGGEQGNPGNPAQEESAESPVDPAKGEPSDADGSVKGAANTESEAAEADAETLAEGDGTASGSDEATDVKGASNEEADAVLADSKPAADASDHSTASRSGLPWLALASVLVGVLVAIWITRRLRARSNAAAA